MKEKTFFDGMFHSGKAAPVEVVERDYACEYSLGPYLAHATMGEEVAVLFATLSFGVEPDDCEPLGMQWEPRFANPNLSWNYETTLVVLPGVGIWVCEPVFDSAQEALVLAQRRKYVIDSFLGEEETPVHIALFAIGEKTPDLRGVDLKYYFGPESYGSVAESLQLRARPFDPEKADAMIRRLMGLIYYSDKKAPDAYELTHPVPRWLTEYAEISLAASSSVDEI